MFFYEKNRLSKEKSIYHQNDVCLNFPPHLHNSFEFICVTDGSITLGIDGESHTLSARGQNAALIMPHQIHNYQTPAYSASYLCVFDNTLVYDFYERVKDKTATPYLFTDYALLKSLQKEEAGVYAVKSVLYAIIDDFCAKAEFLPRNGKRFDVAVKIVEYIENNFKQDVSIKALAAHLGYDYHYLSAILHKTLGVSFPSLVNEYRIQLAQSLMKSGDRTVTEIALQCGYDSIRTFNRNFKQITGKAPTD